MRKERLKVTSTALYRLGPIQMTLGGVYSYEQELFATFYLFSKGEDKIVRKVYKGELLHMLKSSWLVIELIPATEERPKGSAAVLIRQ